MYGTRVLRTGSLAWCKIGRTYSSRAPSKPGLKKPDTVLGICGRPGLLTASDLEAQCVDALRRGNDIRDEILADPPARRSKVVQLFDNLSNTLCLVADLAECMRCLHVDPLFRQSAEAVCGRLLEFIERMNTDRAMYAALRSARDLGDIQPLTPRDRRIAGMLIKEFEMSGVHLSQDHRTKFIRLTQDIFHRQVQFVRSADDESSHSSPRRVAAAPLRELLHSRQALADLCGYESFAHRALSDLMINQPHDAARFLEQLARELKPRIGEERRILERDTGQKWTGSGSRNVNLPELISLWRNVRFGPLTSVVWPLGGVLKSFAQLSHSLFGVETVLSDPPREERWTSDGGLVKMSVRDPASPLLGTVYIDPFHREGKPPDCHFTVVGGRLDREKGTYQRPTVVLSFSIAPHPSLPEAPLVLPQVENVYHELGHAMHSVLTRTEYQHATGTRCPTDFAEVPSNLMECLLYHPEVLRSLTPHVDSGKLDTLLLSRKAMSGHSLQSTVFLALADLRLHMIPGNPDFPSGDPDLEGIYTETYEEVFGMKPEDGKNQLYEFSHLATYGSKYFVYLVARGLARLIYEKEFANDPFSRSAGMRLRTQILQNGGEVCPKEMLENYLGYMPTNQDLTQTLLNEVDSGLN